MVNVMQQLGGSVGLAVLVAVFGTSSRNFAASHAAAGVSAAGLHAQVLSHGVSTAFGLAAIFDVAALLVIALLLRGRRSPVPDTPAGLTEEEVAATAIPE
jgi:hypothetical protein